MHGDVQAATRWLYSEHFMAELQARNPGIPVGDGSPRYGTYAILAEKTGAFAPNLSGILGELTTDIWFTRT